MLEKLKTSLLTAAHAAKLRLEPYPEDHKLDIFPKLAGFKIPYFTLQGKPDKFYRFRFMQVQPSKGWGAVAAPPEKPRRYAQPQGSGCGVYLPPLLEGRKTWKDIAESPSNPILITEGELKAACACACGFDCLGLGGVFNWRSAAQQHALLPILEQFVWKERQVWLCFDSDTGTNPMVRMALSRLAMELLRRGAKVFEVQLPVSTKEKLGLDDYAYQYGVDELRKLVMQAKPNPAGAALHQMNLDMAVVDSTAEIVRLTDGQIMSARNFTEVTYKNHIHHEYTLNQDGDPVAKVKYTAKEWMAWPQRNKVSQLVYQPGQPKLTPGGAYNIWPGWGTVPSARGSMQPWHDLLAHVLQGAKPEHITWLRQWFGWPIQFPGAKLFSAVLVWGILQGTGKTLLGETMAELYGANYRTISSSDLVSQYNDWVVGHQFIVGDEISVGGQARKITDNLKDIITRTSAVVNLKYRAQYTIRDCNNYYFTSNHAEALFIEDADRRYFVHEVQAPPLQPAQYTAYTKWLRQEGGAARLLHYFMHELDLTDFNPLAAPPMTSGKQDMIVYNRSELDAWCATLAQTPDAVLRSAGAALPYSIYTAAELHKMYDPEGVKRVTTNAVSRALRKAGVQWAAHGNNTALVHGARVRLWAVRDGAKWYRAQPAAALKQYEEERSTLRGKGGPRDAVKKERVM